MTRRAPLSEVLVEPEATRLVDGVVHQVIAWVEGREVMVPTETQAVIREAEAA